MVQLVPFCHLSLGSLYIFLVSEIHEEFPSTLGNHRFPTDSILFITASAVSLFFGNAASDNLMWKQYPSSVSIIFLSFTHLSFSILMKKSNSLSSLLSACAMSSFFCSSLKLSSRNCKKSLVCDSFVRIMVKILIILSLKLSAFCTSSFIFASSRLKGTSAMIPCLISSAFSSGFASAVMTALCIHLIFLSKWVNL